HLAEDRRRAIGEQDRAATTTLTATLNAVQRQVENRLQEWRSDLDRTQRLLIEQLSQVGERPGQLIAEAGARIAAHPERRAKGARRCNGSWPASRRSSDARSRSWSGR